MTELVLSQVKSMLEAYATHDLLAAGGATRKSMRFAPRCSVSFSSPRNISFGIHMMFCAKNIERIGDHATNVRETIFYIIEGQQIMDNRPKRDMTTFATTVLGN